MVVFSDIVYAVGILLSGLVLFCFVSIPRLRDFLLRTKQPHSATYRLGYYLPTSWTIFLSRNETKWKPISVNVFENGVLSVTHCRNSVSTTSHSCGVITYCTLSRLPSTTIGLPLAMQGTSKP